MGCGAWELEPEFCHYPHLQELVQLSLLMMLRPQSLLISFRESIMIVIVFVLFLRIFPGGNGGEIMYSKWCAQYSIYMLHVHSRLFCSLQNSFLKGCYLLPLSWFPTPSSIFHDDQRNSLTIPNLHSPLGNTKPFSSHNPYTPRQKVQSHNSQRVPGVPAFTPSWFIKHRSFHIEASLSEVSMSKFSWIPN